MSSRNVKVIDLHKDQYAIDSEKEVFSYEIVDSNLTEEDTRDTDKFNRQKKALLQLPVGKMFVVDRNNHDASNWVYRWGKRLGRKYIVRKRTPNSTEIHRVI